MKQIAEQTNSSWYRQWAENGITRRTVDNNFGRAFHQAVDNAEHIHFSLDGYNLSEIDKAIAAGASGFTKNNMTNAELHYICSNAAALAKTTFYQNGVEVKSPC